MTRKVRESFVVLLDRHREAAGLMWKDVAARMHGGRGVNPSYINRIKEGDKRPSAALVEELGRVLGLGRAEVEELQLAAGHLPPKSEAEIKRRLLARPERLALVVKILALSDDKFEAVRFRVKGWT